MSEENRKHRVVKEGVVASTKMDKTVVVEVTRIIPHPRYGKIVKRKTKCYAHYDNPEKQLNVGDKVTIMETRPLSKLKRWRVVEAV